jgi:predicted ATPase/GAF domain-containing protein
MDASLDLKLERLEYEVDGYLVYRAFEPVRASRCLAKTPGEQFPALVEVERLDRELYLLGTKDGAPPGTLKPLFRIDRDRTSYLLLEHFAGSPIALQCGGGVTVDEAIGVANAVANTLVACHSRRITHLSLGPNTVLWQRDCREVRLTNFGTAPRERLGAMDPPAAVPPWCAPEQTGRLNLPIDERADFYALGNIIYFLLSGSLPFAGYAQHDFVHRLIACDAPALGPRRPDAPQALVDLVSRLLAKDPAERETATGAAEELAELQREGQTTGRGVRTRPPSLGTARFVGRTAELESLLQATRDAASGVVRLVEICGAAGTGKTTLLREFRAAVAFEEPLVLWAKFSQYRRESRSGAVLDALRTFLQRLLGGPQLALQHWQERLLRLESALQPVLVDQLPELEMLLGPQEPAVRLPPTETENRLLTALHALLDILCAEQRSTIFVLDDLQWADAASVRLIQKLFLSPIKRSAVVILARRSPTDTPSEMVNALSLALSEHGALRIELGNLPVQHIFELCSSMVPNCRDTEILSDVVFARSRGNPLFAVQLISAFLRAGRIRWSGLGSEERAWTFVDELRTNVALPDDVVGLIVQRIGELPDACRALLKAAACWGGTIKPRLLAQVVSMPARQFSDALELLRTEALLVDARHAGHLPAGELCFGHDRVEQAARSLCSDEEMEELHTRIGRALWGAQEPPESDDAFAIVSHLNRVDASRFTSDERLRLLELNLATAEIARSGTAYRSALAQLGAAERLLPDDNPQERHFELRRKIGECTYLCSDFRAAELIFDELLLSAATREQRFDVHHTRLVLYLHMQRYGDAIRVGIDALAALGLRLPTRPSMLRLAATGARVMLGVRRATPVDLVNREDRTTSWDRRALELLILLWTPAFWINQPLNGLVGLTLMRLTIRFGTTSESAMALACYSVFLHLVLKRYEQAIQYGELASVVARSKPNPFVGDRVEFITLTFFGPFVRSNRDNVVRYKEAVEVCVRNGEHVFAGCCIDGISSSLPFSGFRLPEIRAELDYCAGLAVRIGSAGSGQLVSFVRAWCDIIVGGVGTDIDVAGTDTTAEHAAYRGVFSLLRMLTTYLWGDDAATLAIARELAGNQIVQSNPLHAGCFDLLQILAACRQPGRNASKRAIRRSLRRLERFAKICDRNFGAALALARAELARVRGEMTLAAQLYRESLSAAATFEHYFIHGVAAERLALLYDSRGERDSYREYLKVAAYSFGRWGASGKVKQLNAAHPAFYLVGDTVAETAPVEGLSIDVEAVMRASYAIAEEGRSDRLATRLLTVVATTAGAQRGFLITRRDDTLWIHARWDMDDKAPTRDPEPLEQTSLLCEAIVRFVARTLETVHLTEADATSAFQEDPYIRTRQPKSILCVPLMTRGALTAVMYLENGVTAGAFGARQRRLVTMLGHQAAISMNNADYHRLQLEALQAKVNPHFLYNALSVISELVVAEPQKAEAALLKLAQLYRYMLTSSADNMVGLDEELRVTQDYLAIESLRFGRKLRWDLQVSGDPKNVRVPALILQPLVENAVKHGIAPKLEGGTVGLSVHVGATRCTIQVEDDGLGWGHGQPGAGVGLKTIRERLALAYGPDHKLVIRREKGVTVVVSLPLTPSSNTTREARVSAS